MGIYEVCPIVWGRRMSVGAHSSPIIAPVPSICKRISRQLAKHRPIESIPCGEQIDGNDVAVILHKEDFPLGEPRYTVDLRQLLPDEASLSLLASRFENTKHRSSGGRFSNFPMFSSICVTTIATRSVYLNHAG